jgi:hypothetical protein
MTKKSIKMPSEKSNTLPAVVADAAEMQTNSLAPAGPQGAKTSQNIVARISPGREWVLAQSQYAFTISL